MPEERGYDSRVAPAAATPMPMASPESLGAGVADAAGRFGTTLHQTQLRAFKIERELKADQETAAVNADMAKRQLAMQQAITDMRANAGPGAAGHADAVRKLIEQQRAGLGEGVTEDRVRQGALSRFDDYAASVTAREYEFEVGKAVGKRTTDIGDTIDANSTLARTSADPGDYPKILKQTIDGIRAQTGIPDDVREKLLTAAERGVTSGFMTGLIDRGEAAKVIGFLDSGAFKDMLDPADHERLRSAAEAEVRRADAQARAQANLGAAAAREAAATVQARLDAGEDVPDREIAQASQGLLALGDTSGGYKLDVARRKSGINRETEGWLPQQYEGELSRLRALGPKRSPEDDVRLKHLETIAPGRIAEFNRDPGIYAERNGLPRPALVQGDPASYAQRLRWRDQVTGATGRRPPVLSAAEAANLSPLATGSPKERLQLINQLAPLGPRGAVDAIRQVAPNDALLPRLALLRPGDRVATIDGQAARKANPALIDGKAGTQARSLFLQRIGPALSLMPQGEVGAIFDIANNLYADHAVKSGKQAWDGGTQYSTFVHRALGGTRVPGTNTYQGGIGAWGGKPVLLPQTMTQARFDQVLTYANWPADHPNAPVFANGTPMKTADVRTYLPVARPDGRYEFHGPDGRVLTARNGGIWTLDIERLGRGGKR